MNCKECDNKAEYVEWSPDGEPDYFCSYICHEQYVKRMNEEGIVWRALPLQKIKVRLI